MGRNSLDEFAVHFPSGILTLHNPPDAYVDLVFVHGLSGDRERTWASPVKTKCWPRDLLPEQIPQARVLTFGYDAYVTRLGRVSRNRIRDHARDLITSLASVRTTEAEQTRSIVFVAHSLGGIVCKDALQLSTNSSEPHLQVIASWTRAILFAATPHSGSSMANWAKIPASALGVVKQTNVNLLAVLHTDSEVRDRIQDDFLTLLRKRQSQGPTLEITCLYETMKMMDRFEVVPENSAVLRGYNSISIRADHRDIVRWKRDGSQGCETIIAEVKRWIHKYAMEYGEVGGIDPRQVRRCVESLTFSEIYDRQSAIERAANETCAWISQDSRYRAWTERENLEKSHGLLWIKGKPGSGKSTLLKYLCERSSPSSGSLRLKFFFNARGTELERSTLGLYRSVMMQLVQNKLSRTAMKPFLGKMLEKEDTLGEGNVTWHLTELQDHFHDVVIGGDMPALELLIDALDECEESQVRRFVRFIGLLASNVVSKGLILNVCWSSRHYPHISTKRCFEIHMEDQNKSDIEKFVHGELLACPTLDGSEFHFEEEIVNRAQGVFLWASLVVQKLAKAADQGLSASLWDIFNSIQPDFRPDTLCLIQWTVFAERPLYLEEFELVLAFSTGSTKPSSLEDFSL
jgi:hypothetical protein